MKTWIALLRGVNVGGKHPLPMKALVAQLQAAGLGEVRSYIQSGNLVFTSRLGAKSLERTIAATIERAHGFAPGVKVLDADALARIAQANPYPEADASPQSVHVWFLSAPAAKCDPVALERLCAPSERWTLAADAFYLHAPDGVGKSRLAGAVERCLGVAATARNWRTVCTLLDLATGG